MEAVERDIATEKQHLDKAKQQEAQIREAELQAEEQNFNAMISGMNRTTQAQGQNALAAEKERTRQLELQVRLKELELEALQKSEGLNDEYRRILAELKGFDHG